MSTNISVSRAMTVQVDPEKAHRSRLGIAYAIAGVLTLVQIVYGSNYYILSQANRALSPKHEWLKPSGVIGLHLGMVAFALFLIVYVYPLRKIWPWLHSSFKFSGLAGVAFWIMVIVALSGFVGRYIYAQIPRSLGFAEVSLKDAKELSDKLTEQLSSLGILSPKDVETLVRFPSSREFEQMSVLTALWKMMVFDMEYPMRVWRLRQKMLWSHRKTLSLVGLRRTHNVKLENAIATAREQAVLTKKIMFLSKTHQMLHLWHMIHRPFSYSFALLASIHVILMLMLGYY